MKDAASPVEKLGRNAAWILLVLALITPLLTFSVIILTHLEEFDPLHLPFNSAFVVGMTAVTAVVGLIASYLLHKRQRQKNAAFDALQRSLDTTREKLDKTSNELDDLRKRPVSKAIIAAVRGYDKLPSAEYLALLQTLFSSRPDVKYLHVSPLSGGHGGSMTVLARLQRGPDESPEPKSYVVKLGEQSEMDGERARYERYVKTVPMHAPILFGYSSWGSYAGTAYEFAQLQPDGHISSFYEVYSHPPGQIADLITRIFSHLEGAWYKKGREESVSLNDEYWLLAKKKMPIIGAITKIVDAKDPYHQNFAAAPENLRPKLKPNFCPSTVRDWHDPVVFLHNWPRLRPPVTIHRSVVHGDLHAQNVLIEEGRSGDKDIWFIDFSHTGNGLSDERTKERQSDGVQLNPDHGHTLRDFCRMEADVKFILTQLSTSRDLSRAVEFERELVRCGLELYDLSATPPSDGFPVEDERFRKAWQVIREIRHRAASYLVNKSDLQPYYFSLLNATLPMVCYHPDQFANEDCEKQQKRYALLAAGMACAQL